MTDVTNVTEDLQTALAATREILAGIAGDQWSLATPCSDWTVDQLAAHLILGNQLLAARLRGEDAPMAGAGADLSLVDADRLAAFGADGALERMVTVPFGTVPGAVALDLRLTELIVHGWDLARATGQHIEVPDALAGRELAFAQRVLPQLPPDRAPFAPPQPVSPGACPLDQLVGLLGRQV